MASPEFCHWSLGTGSLLTKLSFSFSASFSLTQSRQAPLSRAQAPPGRTFSDHLAYEATLSAHCPPWWFLAVFTPLRKETSLARPWKSLQLLKSALFPVTRLPPHSPPIARRVLKNKILSQMLFLSSCGQERPPRGAETYTDGLWFEGELGITGCRFVLRNGSF